ncbi:MAG: cytidine/deoxycytidylate deaminase family protein [Candidatus Omnitrophica bacterium]|nr:cytidine/deoxycytidylate deaminase family protein [Candidatus Omnitrophota bacterium]MBU4479007.1 cytidine/deoxycytidylate deaminase family protein [Candidatus Omnitrophota bacterium]MCG2703802.1 cytidine/deoxycytidylate deaminase family protein [Candidatus Omnitrophota bacterium]MCG2711301.1 cytidine/deoxycytidylate deaminase family protein [Candidatus Omnitrophota bacterium]
MAGKKQKKMLKRPSWDEYFIDIAQLVAKRSTCLRRQVGAVIVKGKRILTTGYNGAPSGLAHCEKTGCLREALSVPSGQRHELCRALHAEMNALLQAAQDGISVKDGILYCTNEPCIICAKMIINAGITRVVVLSKYPDKFAKKILEEAKIEVVVANPDISCSV